MMENIRLHVTLEPMGPATAIVLTDEHVAQLGGGKRAPVVITIGEHTAPGRIARMGGQNLIGLSKQRRSELGVEIGDEVDVSITLDTFTREVEVSPFLQAALDAQPGAQEAFDVLAPSKRKEFNRQVTEAKQEATRQRRIQRILEQL